MVLYVMTRNKKQKMRDLELSLMARQKAIQCKDKDMLGFISNINTSNLSGYQRELILSYLGLEK